MARKDRADAISKGLSGESTDKIKNARYAQSLKEEAEFLFEAGFEKESDAKMREAESFLKGDISTGRENEQAIQELQDNPLQAALFVRAIRPQAYAQISEALRSPKYEPLVARITYDDNRDVINRLTNIVRTNIGIIIFFSKIFQNRRFA